MKKLMLVACLVMSLNASAKAVILDNVTCGSFMATDGVARIKYSYWFYGYLSGENMRSSVDFLERTDSQGVLAALEKYCLENPLDYFTQAVVAVRTDLQKRANK